MSWQRPDDGDALLLAAGDAIIAAAADGSVLLWNPAAERVFGYTEGEALGRSLDLIVPERFRSRHWKGYRRVMRTGSTRYVVPAHAVLPCELAAESPAGSMRLPARVRNRGAGRVASGQAASARDRCAGTWKTLVAALPQT